MRALEQLKDTERKMKEANEELNQAKVRSRAVAAKFETVKKQRKDAFMNMFQRVSAVIDNVYKDLTKSTTHPTGGSATLFTENDWGLLQKVKTTPETTEESAHLFEFKNDIFFKT